MKKLSILFALSLSAFAVPQGLVTDAITKRVNRPASFLTLTAFRLEGRVTLPDSCNVINANSIQSTGAVGLACISNDATQWGFGNGSTVQVVYAPGTSTPATFVPGEKYMFSVQRTGITSSDSFQMKIWAIDGTVVGYRSVIVSGAWDRAQGNTDVLAGNTNPGMTVHHLCWYSDAVADLANAAMPHDNTCDNGTLTEVGGFLFDGNRNGISGINMTCFSTCTSEVYKHSTISETNDGIYPDPVAQAKVIGTLSAGSPVTLDASGTVRFDGTTTTSATFTAATTPVPVLFTNVAGTQVTIPYMVKGVYQFWLSVPGSTRLITFDVPLKDTQGHEVMPSNNYLTANIKAKYTAVAGATRMRLRALKSDGAYTPYTTCTSATGDCTVLYDPQQKNHTVEILYCGTGNCENTPSDVKGRTGFPLKLAVTQQIPPIPPATSTETYIKLWATSPTVQGSASNAGEVSKFAARKSNVVSGSDHFMIRGVNNIPQPVYSDSAGTTPGGWHRVNDLADVHNYNCKECLYLHYPWDYQTVGKFIWTGLDLFDRSETSPTSSTTYVNGIKKMSGTTVSQDVTMTLQTNDATDITLANGEGLMMGRPHIFDEVNFTLDTSGTGCTLNAYYLQQPSNTWAALTLRSDTTGNFNTPGTGKIMFTPPGDWARITYAGAGAYKKFWVRFEVTGCSGQPVVGMVRGEDWMNGPLLLRGWVDSNCTHNCSDPDRAYNINYATTTAFDTINGVAKASGARYKAQARCQGIWSNNTGFMNQADVQNGELTIPRIVVDRRRFYQDVGSDGYCHRELDGLGNLVGPPTLPVGGLCWAGMWVDNGDPIPNVDGYQSHLSAAQTALATNIPEMNGKVWYSTIETHYQAIIDYTRSLWGTGVGGWVGINSVRWNLCKLANFCYDETFKYAHFTIYPKSTWSYDGVNAGPYTVDPARTSGDASGANTNSTQMHIEMYDNRPDHQLTGNNTVYTSWDRGHRGPMSGQASYLQYKNPNTRYFYHNGASFYYFELAEFYEVATTPTYTITGIDGATSDIRAGKSHGTGSITTSGGVGTITLSGNHTASVGDWVWMACGDPMSQFGQVTATPAPNQLTVTGLKNGTFSCDVLRALTVRGDFTNLSTSGETFRMKDANAGDYVRWFKIDNTRAGANDIVATPLAVGDGFFKPNRKDLWKDPLPPVERIWKWGQLYPSLFIDLGNPLEASSVWMSAAASNTPNGVRKREYEKAVVLHADIADFTTVTSTDPAPRTATVTNGSTTVTFSGNTLTNVAPDVMNKWSFVVGTRTTKAHPTYTITYVSPTQGTLDRPYAETTASGASFTVSNNNLYDVYSPEIDFATAGWTNSAGTSTLYPLLATGKTSNSLCEPARRTNDGGCTAIKIRTSEGLILMKEPVY